MTEAELDVFLAKRHVARLGTCGADGYAYVTPVWYVWRNRRLLFVLGETRLHVRHLRRSPKASVCIDEDPRPRHGLGAGARGVVLLGPVTLSRPVHLAADERNVTPVFLEIARRYLGPPFGELDTQPEGIRAERRVLVTLTAERCRSWDFRKRRSRLARGDRGGRE